MFDDLPLHRSNAPGHTPKPPAQPSPTRWIVVGAAVVIAGSLLALWWIVRSQPDTATPAPTRATDLAVGAHRPRRQPIELPGLDASDGVVAEMARTLSQNPLIQKLLTTTGLIREAALTIQQIGDGKTPADPLRLLQPTSRLAVVGGDSGRIDPKSYARWDAATNALTSIDPNLAAQFYVNVKPLFDQAYRDFGHPSGDFDEAIVRAIQTLSATPATTSDPEVMSHPDHPGYFEHVDPTLRSALPVQKQFLLIGPANRKQILAWLRDLATSLELHIGG